MADIEIEIDGIKLTAQPNQTVIQVADAAGIYIPRFCYHPHLSIPANCRMCLVEIAKAPKTLPACATVVAPGMQVFTKTQKTLAAQRAVMEFLLINHPLDCPICDQGGECELQDLAMGYGSGFSHYTECKRSVADENLGPLIATEMTRCIACTRCVRFGDEVAGVRELGLIGRGEETQISTYIKHAMRSEVSGNIIDICPVGALTAKPSRFTARAWELDQAPSISPHDGLGTNINIHTRYGTVMRVVARENQNINQTWIADRERFSYTGLYTSDRLEEPMIKVDGQWQAVDWRLAFEVASEKLRAVLAEHGADKIGALASPQSTLEEFYLLQKVVRGLGSPHIDHRLREKDTDDQIEINSFSKWPLSLDQLEACDAILLIGSHLQKEIPLAAVRVRQAALQGASILTVNAVDYPHSFAIAAKTIVAPHYWPQTLATLIEFLKNESKESNDDVKDESIHALVSHLRDKKNVAILLGAQALHHTQAATLRRLAANIAELIGAKVCFLTQGANAAGGCLTGAVPHCDVGGVPRNHMGLNAHEMLAKPRKAYLLLNVEPDVDCGNAAVAIEALKEASTVIALSLYRHSTLEAHADVIFPMAPFTETAGTFINVFGEWQSFKGVAKPFAASRPAWKILRVLGNFLQLSGFDYDSAESVKHEIKEHCMAASKLTQASSTKINKPVMPTATPAMLTRIGEIPIYAVDSLVRQAKPLQEMQTIMEGELAVIRLHPDTASQLGLEEGGYALAKQQSGEVVLPVVIDSRIAREAVWIPGGISATRHLGDLMGAIDIQRVQHRDHDLKKNNGER